MDISGNRASEKGSAIVYVFIGISLFGALMFLFSHGASQNSSGMNTQQAKVVASEVIDYSNNISKIVNNLMVNQCAESEINFYLASTFSANPSARADGSCDVFKSRSDYVSLKQMGAQSTLSYWTGDNWFFSSYIMGVVGVGPDTYIDLTAQAPNLKRDVCLEINNLLGIKNPSGEPPRSPSLHGGLGYVGTLSTGNGREINPVGNPLYGLDAGCYVAAWADGTDRYYYYKVLVPH